MGSSDNVCHRNATHCRQRLIVKRRSRRRRHVPQLNPRVSFQLTESIASWANGKLPLALVVNQQLKLARVYSTRNAIDFMDVIVWSR